MRQETLKFEFVSHLFKGRLHCLASDKRKLDSVFTATAPVYQPYLKSDYSHSLPQAPRELDVSIAWKTKFAASLYQTYFRSDSLHSPPQVLGSYCVHGVNLKNYPLPSEGSEDVAIIGAAQPKPRDTLVHSDGCGALTCARATENYLVEKCIMQEDVSTTQTIQGCVHTM